MSTIEDRHDIAALRERRRRARRRRGLARLDAALALAGALVVLLAAPGLAIAGLVAIVLLAVCAASLVWEWTARRRSARAARRRSAGGGRRVSATAAGELRRR